MIRWIKRMLRRGEGPRTPGQEAAASAIRRIESAQTVSDSREPEVARVAALMRRLQRENNFAHKFERALRGGH